MTTEQLQTARAGTTLLLLFFFLVSPVGTGHGAGPFGLMMVLGNESRFSLPTKFGAIGVFSAVLSVTFHRWKLTPLIDACCTLSIATAWILLSVITRDSIYFIFALAGLLAKVWLYSKQIEVKKLSNLQIGLKDLFYITTYFAVASWLFIAM